MFVNKEALMDLGKVLLLDLDTGEPIILVRHLPIIVVVDLLHLPEVGAQSADAVLNSIAPLS